MKRLLAQIGITYFSALAVVFYLSDNLTLILCFVFLGVSALLFFLRKFHQKIYLPLMALAVAVGCAVNLLYTSVFIRPIEDRFDGRSGAISATLLDEPEEGESSFRYRLRIDRVDGEDCSFKTILTFQKQLDIEPFDILEFQGSFSIPKGRYADYFRSKGCVLFVDVTGDITVKHETDRPLYAAAISIRKTFRAVIDDLLPYEDATLARAVLIGDKKALPTRIKDDFRFSGASYFVVVSGMHFALLTGAILWLLRKLTHSRFVYVPVAMAFSLLYMAVTGFAPSVMRSGVMVLVMLLSLLMRRIPDPLTSLGAAGIVLPFVFSPYGAGDIGLILSFYATFAILMWAPPLFERLSLKEKPEKRSRATLQKLANFVIGLFCASLAANILVFPIMLWFFHAFSLVTLVSALLLYPLISLILLITLLMCLIALIPPFYPVAVVISWPLWCCCEATLFLVRALSSLPFSYIKTDAPFLWIWLICSVILFLGWRSREKRIPSLRVFALSSLAILLAGVVSASLFSYHGATLTVFPAGEGNLVALTTDDAAYVLDADAGASYLAAAIDELSLSADRCGFAVSSSEKETSELTMQSSKEFDFSGMMEYDEKRAGVETHSRDIRLSDDVTYHLGVTKSGLFHYITTPSSTALVCESTTAPEDIPVSYRTADIAVLAKAIASHRLISCSTLVISGHESVALIAASELDNFRVMMNPERAGVRLKLDPS